VSTTLHRLVADLPTSDVECARVVHDRSEENLRPRGAHGVLDTWAAWLAGWQRTTTPHVDRPALVLFFGDHGIIRATEVSAFPADITAEVFRAHQQGKSTAAVFAKELGVQDVGVDVGIGRPTGDIRHEPALDHARFEETVELATATVDSLDADLLIFGEVGIGNTTAAAAVAAAMTDRDASGWTGRGSGLDDAGLARKIEAVDVALRRVAAISDPVELLRQVGGAELVAIAAGVATARRRSIPVILDGFVVGASALVLHALDPTALEHCIAGHCSAELGHRRLLTVIGREPLLDLGLRLGEGSGALAALPLLRLAIRGVLDLPTFSEWRAQ